jgi:prolyl-tRNA editing enzyme YbaK/EbsC (Cys-tRNA(Pro) deacylase)
VRSSVDVHNFLLDSDVPHEISSLPGPLRDLADAPEVLGLPSVAVARSVVLADEQGVVVVVVPARSDIDQAAVASLTSRPDLAPVDAEQVPARTGYLLHVVPPVALEGPAEVVVDRLVAEQDVVYTAAGEAGMILKVRGPDLVKATNALVVPVARPR